MIIRDIDNDTKFWIIGLVWNNGDITGNISFVFFIDYIRAKRDWKWTKKESEKSLFFTLRLSTVKICTKNVINDLKQWKAYHANTPENKFRGTQLYLFLQNSSQSTKRIEIYRYIEIDR